MEKVYDFDNFFVYERSLRRGKPTMKVSGPLLGIFRYVNGNPLMMVQLIDGQVIKMIPTANLIFSLVKL